MFQWQVTVERWLDEIRGLAEIIKERGKLVAGPGFEPGTFGIRGHCNGRKMIGRLDEADGSGGMSDVVCFVVNVEEYARTRNGGGKHPLESSDDMHALKTFTKI